MKALLTCLLALLLSACAVSSHDYISSKPLADFAADDVTAKLEELYPPAKTTFKFNHFNADVFGSVLSEKLRQKGFAVIDFAEPPTNAIAPDGENEVETETANVTAISYLVDSADVNIARVIITLENKTMSRAYVFDDRNNVSIAAPWTVKGK